MNRYSINLNSVIELTGEQFFQLCRNNPDLKFERSAQGELVIMPPTGGETGRRNLKISQQLGVWTDQDATGVAFDSSTCFRLSNGADRSPDASWIQTARWDSLTPEQKEKFPPICPDFVIELMSPSDSLTATQAKMQEYRDNGAKLGWLLNRKDQQVEIYRPHQPVERLQQPDCLSGAALLPGFVLNLAAIWQ
jgi:Uma2 family endonuclease